jgi:hypothetical protein
VTNQICAIYVDPPIAVARLGGSTTPLEAYRWVDAPNPRADGETAIEPTWSLRVRADATLDPYLPTEIQFRDGGLIRPVCPFFEIHALLGNPKADPATWINAPLTEALLARHKLTLHDIELAMDAQNHKAARRTGNPDLRFGTFPPVTVRADHTHSVALAAVSPPGAVTPMIPKDKSIPLGFVQFLRAKPQPATSLPAWASAPTPVRLDVLRFRFTPAQGHMYGPPQSAQPLPTPSPRKQIAPVDAERAFLDPAAGWWGATVNQDVIAPWDTYDGADVRADHSFGVVDDTCEAELSVTLRVHSRALTARCSVFVAPPDFGPDRRPVLSLADELNDRASDGAARTAAMSAAERDAWVRDLFSRIYETVSLMNVDVWRGSGAMPLSGAQLRHSKIPDDHVPAPRDALGGYDALRDPVFTIPAANSTQPLPITTHARGRHRSLMDLDAVRDLIGENPGLMRRLVRGPFEVEAGEDQAVSTMRMPPFMRNSNAFPLTLAGWQYDLLMKWVAHVEAGGDTWPTAAEEGFAAQAEERRGLVLSRVRNART